MQRHIYRSQDYSPAGDNVKSFHKAKNILQVHHHLSRVCLRGPCKGLEVDTEVGHVQHYRKDCYEQLGKLCSNYTKSSKLETGIWKIKVSSFS